MPKTAGTQKAIVDYILVYLLIFLSGSWRYNLSADKLLVVGLFVALCAWYLFSDRRINHKFLLYVAVFAGLLFQLNIYTGGSLSLSSVISSTIKILIAYLIVRTVGERFIDTYVKVIVFLAVISLFGYVIDMFNLFDGFIRKLPRVGDMGYEGFLYVYRFSWHITRNNSIFFEPGAYQAFLNAALFMLFFVRTGFSPKRKNIYAVILIATLVTTFSTTGFLIFLIMVPLFLYKSELLSYSGKAVLVGVGVALIAVLSNQIYFTVVTKVEDYLTANEYDFGYSAQNRSSDAKTDIKIFKKHVFGVGHNDYVREFGVAGRLDTVGGEGMSSNGVTKLLAVYGLPFSLFLFGSYYWALKRMLGEFLLASLAFVMFMMFLAGESYYIASPICYSIIASAFIVQRMPKHREIQSE